MAKVEIIGQVTRIDQAQEFNGTLWRHFFIMEVNEFGGSNTFDISLSGDKCPLIDMFQVGSTVKITGSLVGKMKPSQQGREFCNMGIKCWSIVNPYQQQPRMQQSQFHQQMPPQYAQQTPPGYSAQPEYGPQSLNNYGPTQAMQGMTPQMGAQQPPLFNPDGSPAPF